MFQHIIQEFSLRKIPILMLLEMSFTRIVCNTECKYVLDKVILRVIDITSFEKHLKKFFRSYSKLLSKFGDISFQEYVSKGISHPVFYGDLVLQTKESKRHTKFHLVGFENSLTPSTTTV